MQTLLISTYELGRQPFGLASPAAWLRNAGVDVTCLDLSRESFRAELASADLIGFHLPMHTATRLAVPVIRLVRTLNPNARVCCYGLYAPLNAEFLRSLGVQHILGGEFEHALVELAIGTTDLPAQDTLASAPRLEFVVPDRHSLPPPSRYATLQHGSERRVTGYTEASRGCKHFCRHCPVVPVYNGQFRIVPVDVVLADIRMQVELGARHITFGDPDFFNGIGHAMRVVDGVAREFAGVTYDLTIKVEHLLRYGDRLRRLQETGCLFVTSAAESFDDDVLTQLKKQHTRADIHEAVRRCREAGLTLTPTFVAFTPWTTLDGYCGFLEELDRFDLVDQVATIQLAIRLLVPYGSRLLELAPLRSSLQPFDPVRLTYPWRHPDSRVDALCSEIGEVVSRGLSSTRRDLFVRIWELAHARAGVVSGPHPHVSRGRVEVPYLNEPWYC